MWTLENLAAGVVYLRFYPQDKGWGVAIPP